MVDDDANLCLIRFLVEIGKQEVEKDRMRSDEVGKVDRVIAFVADEQLECVQHHQDELHHLDEGQVLLPPQILLHFGSHGGQHIVGVHQNVDECVEEAEERAMAAGRELHSPPHRGWHQSMVDDVQRGDLVVPFAHHKENGVQELGEFGEEVPPATGRHLDVRDIYIYA